MVFMINFLYSVEVNFFAFRCLLYFVYILVFFYLLLARDVNVGEVVSLYI